MAKGRKNSSSSGLVVQSYLRLGTISLSTSPILLNLLCPKTIVRKLSR